MHENISPKPIRPLEFRRAINFGKRERCDEDFNLLLGDGTTKVFLNTEGISDDVDEDIKNFLNYVARGVVADNFIKELDSAVWDVKSAEKVRLEYVTLELMIRERTEKARQEGRTEGTLAMIKNLLKANTYAD